MYATLGSVDGKILERTGPPPCFAVLEGAGHQYPNGVSNPAGFASAREFWALFSAHRLP